MSEHSSSHSPLGIVAYGLVAIAIAFEVGVLWLALHPQVPQDYRAYYIDQSTTCLNQPVSGDYALGTIVSFRSDGLEAAKLLRVCGWEGPAGDGTHAVGRTSRLRFAIPALPSTPLRLTLELVAVAHEGHPSQRVVISANGQMLDTPLAQAGTPLTIDLEIPAAVVAAHPDSLELAMDFPDAIRMSPGDSDTRMRSIKLLSARLGPAP